MKLKLWLKLHKANKAGLAPVSLRITIAGQRAEITTDLRLRPDQWDQSNQCIIVTSKADALNNDYLDDLKAEARSARAELRQAGKEFTARAVADNMRGQEPTPQPCLLERLHSIIESHYRQANQGTLGNCVRALELLQLWHGRTVLRLDAFGVERRQAFADYLLKRMNPASTRTYLDCLSAMWTRAKTPGLQKKVFTEVVLPRHRAKPKASLSREQLTQLAKVELSGQQHHARNIYLACFYLHGSRISAVLRVRWQDYDGQRVRYQAMKGGPLKSVLVAPALRVLLESYRTPSVKPTDILFPFLPAEFFALDKAEQFRYQKMAVTRVGTALRAACKHAGLPGNIHPHTARHTMARMTIEATKDMRAAQHILGHSNPRQTEIYIRSMLTEEIDSAASSVYDSL